MELAPPPKWPLRRERFLRPMLRFPLDESRAAIFFAPFARDTV
jgi:hypothetical protein